ncbi:MAG: Oligosaccharyl transferase, subunit, partial [Myxococcaceae bacterium]|nr:Oligosaccharyl transferase, subunit [Myxococcaceae bacterium]
MSNVVRPRVAVVRGASVALLAALTLVARASMRAQVFDGGEVTPVEVDAFYHLRRIARTAEHFPALPLRDPLVDWPRGAVVPWPEGYDWTVAALARLAGCSTPRAVEVFAAWSPVAAGLAVVLGTYALCLRLLRGECGASGAAFLAGLVAALAPQSVATSLVGRIDHHVVEQASVLGLLAWCLARPAADATPAAALRFELAGAAVLGLSLWCFNGSVLYAAVAAGVLGL